MDRTALVRIVVAAGFAALATFALHALAAGGGTAKGTMSYKAKSGPIDAGPRYAYFVKGPDPVDGKPIRRLILSETDLGAAIAACAKMTCTDAGLTSGIGVDLDAGPRLNYWVSLDGQRVQYSGTEKPSSLTLTADTPTRLAGRLAFDASGAGGPKVDIAFDAPLVKELKQGR